MNTRPPIPTVVLVYGLLGVMPFVAAPAISLAIPIAAGMATVVQATYGALILSFLGGARWGQEVARPAPRVMVVSLTMLPTLAALGLLMVTVRGLTIQLGLVLLLLVHWMWDMRAVDFPGWYPRLRTILTVGAVAGLVAQVLVVARAL